MRMLSIALALLVGLSASMANAAVLLTFEGFVTGPGVAPPNNYVLTLEVDAGGSIVGGVYDQSGVYISPIVGGTVTGAGTATITFNALKQFGGPAEFVLVGSSGNVLADYSLAAWESWGVPSGTDSSGNFGGNVADVTLVSAVPEPTTWALMGSIVAGASVVGWRRRRALAQA